MGFRTDTGLQIPPILSPVPDFKPLKSNNKLLYTEYSIFMLYTLFYNST